MHSSRTAGIVYFTATPFDILNSENIDILSVQVWNIKLTLHFLSDEGNMLDCACIAGIAALRHFRKPDVEVIGEETIVVSATSHGNGLSQYQTVRDTDGHSMTLLNGHLFLYPYITHLFV